MRVTSRLTLTRCPDLPDDRVYISVSAAAPCLCILVFAAAAAWCDVPRVTKERSLARTGSSAADRMTECSVIVSNWSVIVPRISSRSLVEFPRHFWRQWPCCCGCCCCLSIDWWRRQRNFSSRRRRRTRLNAEIKCWANKMNTKRPPAATNETCAIDSHYIKFWLHFICI